MIIVLSEDDRRCDPREITDTSISPISRLSIPYMGLVCVPYRDVGSTDMMCSDMGRLVRTIRQVLPKVRQV